MSKGAEFIEAYRLDFGDAGLLKRLTDELDKAFAVEREACAKIADEYANDRNTPHDHADVAKHIAELIRARG